MAADSASQSIDKVESGTKAGSSGCRGAGGSHSVCGARHDAVDDPYHMLALDSPMRDQGDLYEINEHRMRAPFGCF
jgi:hypothetical protein